MENQRLTKRILSIHLESRGTYGSPRVHAELRCQGIEVGRNRVERLMRAEGVTARLKRRFRRTTDSAHDYPVAPNTLDRQFETDEPNQVWTTDITYIWTQEGWLYLAVVMDLFSRRIVGWSMSDNMRTELVLAALTMAIGNRLPDGELMHHSDRGSQYASFSYQKALQANGITCSMSRRANCLDNAVAESFFGTIKTELIHRHTWPSRDSARLAIHEYIEVFYNRRRRHSTLGMMSPAEFEDVFNRNAASAA
jgi:transposase InsO family protein